MRFYIPTMESVPVNPTEAPSSMAVPWTVGDAAKATALVVGGTMLLVLLAGPALRLLDGQEEVLRILFLSIPEGMLILAVWRFGPWRYSLSWRALGFQAALNNGAFLALVVFLASISFTVIYSLAMTVLGLDNLTPPALPGELMETYLQRIAAFLLIVMVAPVAEEMFFRGFLLPVFVGRWGFVWGATFVSLLFSASHLMPGVLVPVFVSGLLFAWLYRRTGSLWNCCLAHGAQNALAFAVTVSM